MTFKTNIAAAIVASSVLFGAVAHAEQNDQAGEISALVTAKLDAAAAIAAVESVGKGKVVELALQGNGTAVVYAITLMAEDGSETNFVVDAKNGNVVEVGDIWTDEGDGDGETMDDGPQDQVDGDGETLDDGPGSQGDGDGEVQD